MRGLRLVGVVAAAVGVLIASVALLARVHDGPLGLLPGGPLAAGRWMLEPVDDWAFAADQDTIELQLLAQQRSRTTWILVHEGSAFVPCSLGFPPGKNWYRVARRDGRAVLRIGGRRYPVNLDRVEDAALAKALGHVARAKYGAGPPGQADVWYFRVTSSEPEMVPVRAAP